MVTHLSSEELIRRLAPELLALHGVTHHLPALLLSEQVAQGLARLLGQVLVQAHALVLRLSFGLGLAGRRSAGHAVWAGTDSGVVRNVPAAVVTRVLGGSGRGVALSLSVALALGLR